MADRFGKELVVVALGPLTNLATALERDPRRLGRAGRIVVMEGAVAAPGNVTPAAEFQLLRGPEAAALVSMRVCPGAGAAGRHSPGGAPPERAGGAPQPAVAHRALRGRLHAARLRLRRRARRRRHRAPRPARGGGGAGPIPRRLRAAARRGRVRGAHHAGNVGRRSPAAPSARRAPSQLPCRDVGGRAPIPSALPGSPVPESA